MDLASMPGRSSSSRASASRPAAAESARGLKTPHAALLLGMIGHEVRNLMTPIVSRAQKARRNAGDTEAVTRDLERISQNALRAVEVTTALLHAGKAAHERRDTQRFEVTSAAEATEVAVEVVGGDLAARGVVLLAAIDEDVLLPLPTALLRSVVVNLLINAGQATAPGGRVEARTIAVGTCSTWNTPVVGIEVIDGGVGMSPSQIARATGAFEQGDRAGGGGVGSIGLGLAVCRWLVEETGGRLEIISSPGLGTTVRCVWRAAAPVADGAAEHDPAA